MRALQRARKLLRSKEMSCRARHPSLKTLGVKKNAAFQIGLSGRHLGVKNNVGTPRLFLAKSEQTIGKKEDTFCSFARERKSEDAGCQNGVPDHRQSRWLSKERGYGRGKRDRCQNKGDSKSGPDCEPRKSRPLAEVAARCSGAKLSKNEKKTIGPSSEQETMV